MRIAIVSPYSWTYPGGVNRHVEALALELMRRGEHVDVLAPWDPPDRRSARRHRGIAAERREQPSWLVPLGRTVGIPANGAVSNLSVSPEALQRMRAQLRGGRYDIVHVHEPIAPALGWDATLYASARGIPVVGTFHTYSPKAFPNRLANVAGARRVFSRLSARIAVSEAAAWTGRRWFGGHYEIVPNGVDLDAAPSGPKPEADGLRILFIGRAEERKGLPVLLNAFGALTEQLPSRLSLVGTDPSAVERLVADPEVMQAIDVHGRVDDEGLWRELHAAHVLCAPSLTGESFGMVLTEAFAAGTPVVASRIAGYSDVVTDGVDGLLVPPADPQALGEALQVMAVDPEQREAMGRAARRSAERYAWPSVAERVVRVYGSAVSAPEPISRVEAVGRRLGLMAADGTGPATPRRMASLEPPPARASRRRRVGRRLGLGAAGLLGVGLAGLAVHRVGLHDVLAGFVQSSPAWLMFGLGLMVVAMLLRAASWHAIIRAALPGRPVRGRDVTSATMIGVLMSATLPARLGEPARALVAARRVGRVRETFPVLVGTLVSQTVLNVLALIVLGVVIVTTSDLFHRSQEAVFLASLAPLVLLIAVLLAPALVRGGGRGRLARVLVTVRGALESVRRGLVVFRHPRLGATATLAQLGAWAIQLASFYVLLLAMGLDHQAGLGGAAAALFAVNVTAVLPATPSNVGVFQLAVIAVLTTGYGVGAADALAYGVVLQAVEILTALALGLPALVREGLTWSDMRLRAIQAAPVRLPPLGAARARAEAARQAA